MAIGSKPSSRRTGMVTPTGVLAARATPHKAPPSSGRSGSSDFKELTPAEERTTAYPADLKDSVMPELRRMFAASDFETVLPMAEALLQAGPDEELRAVAATCRSKLTDAYSARLGRLSRVPVLKVPPNEWRTLDLDHRACFLLVNIDNVSSFDMILDMSGMSRHEAMRILCDLLERGIISV